MKVIIPLAGKGSRMRPHTHTKAKPLLPVAGKPVLDHVMDALKGLDISEYIFITGHLKEQIEEHIKKSYDVKSVFIEQTVKDGTAGAIKLAKEYVDEPVLIIFVDTVFDADLSIIKSTKDDGILWAQEVEDYSRFGVILKDENDHMLKMIEKPSEPISKLANIGLYYVKDYKLLFDGIQHVYDNECKVKGEYVLTDAFQYMVDQGAKLKVAQTDGWYDCGKPETTLSSNAVLLKRYNEIKSDVKNTKIIEPVFIDIDCDIEGCTIGPNVSISKGCTIKKSVIKDSIIDEYSTVENIELSESILGASTYLEGTGHKMSVLLGDHSRTKLH